jgi:hypothetical protein
MARAGRKRKLDAKRRQSSRLGRQPPDPGSPELRKHKILLAGSVMAEADVLGVLRGRDLISEDALRAGRSYNALTRLARRGWGLSEGSVNDLWRRLISGIVDGEIGTPRPLSAEGGASDNIARARMALAKQRKALEAAGLHVMFTTHSVVLDNYWSAAVRRLVNGQPGKRGDWRYLGDLREGLSVLAGLRRGRDELGRAAAAE